MRRTALVILILATLFFLLSLAPAAMMILYSPMVFDAGETRSLWTFVITLWTYPVTVLGAVIVSWILFALRCHRAAIACALLPLLHLGVLAVQIFVVGDGR